MMILWYPNPAWNEVAVGRCVANLLSGMEGVLHQLNARVTISHAAGPSGMAVMAATRMAA